MKELDFVERATLAFLESLALGKVNIEPNGPTTFPDFSIGGRIGVECTRLVHRVEKSGQLYNLDELEPRIIHSLEGTFKRLPFGNLTSSYFVCLDFDIDIDLSSAKNLLKSYLIKLTQSNAVMPHRHKLSGDLEIEIFKSTQIYDSPFALGAMNTRESGGWVLDQLSSQTRDAIRRKSESVAKSSCSFDEWWLAVSGWVAVGLSETYAEFITKELNGTEIWHKVLLIDPHDPSRSKIIEIS